MLCEGLFTPCSSVQTISMSTWFQAITRVILMISVYDMGNCPGPLVYWPSYLLMSEVKIRNNKLWIGIFTAKCCKLYASLHDRFRLEVRILFYPMTTLKLAAWVTLIIAGMRWWAGQGREHRWREARGSGRSPGGVQERSPGGRFDCHETNLKCFINKFCHEMRHDLWR